MYVEMAATASVCTLPLFLLRGSKIKAHGLYLSLCVADKWQIITRNHPWGPSFTGIATNLAPV